MKKKTALKWLGIIICTLCIMYVLFIITLMLNNDNREHLSPSENWPTEIPTRTENTAQQGLPIRITIPKTHTDALFEYVGITNNGNVGAPENPAKVAWFNASRLPGEKGVSIITGHYGWKNNVSAAFDNLHSLAPGDVFYIDDEKDIRTTFIVQKIEIYKEQDVAYGVFHSEDTDAHLNLITCDGTWDKIRKSYSDRLVVFSIKN